MTPTAEMVEGWYKQAHATQNLSEKFPLSSAIARLAFAAGQEAMRERAAQICAINHSDAAELSGKPTMNGTQYYTGKANAHSIDADAIRSLDIQELV